ncbi:LacI family DNA-binding transcriptional regulator [Actinomyces polynesiensis]|uniref:LacI family DNA-binding transcriptional regulator n=1 Tax=Actinomyces polynesiensis TaxID=1325934 RepID=UPI0005B86C9F|nr:LacI family DNA-binding transcriptional regulator [Actinomyces polynesiensis]
MSVDPRSAVTLEDVARAAGVSRATASRVVRGDSGVSEPKARAVREAVTTLRYVPNRAARSLVTRRTDTVALVVPEPDQRIFSDPFFAITVQAVSEALEDTDIQLVMAFADRAGSHQRLRSFLHDGHVDGAIVVSHHQIPGQIETFMRAAIPVVFIGRPARATSSQAWVDVDNREGGRIAARRLLEGGSRAPAVITGTLDMVAAQDRLEGFTQQMGEAGTTPLVVQGSFTRDSGTRAGTELLPMIRGGQVDGVFACSDLMALGAMEVWRREGVRVPDDVRIVSFDDLEAGALADPPLTSITNPVERMGREAIRMLRERLENRGTERPVLLPTQLVPRVSG